jgi:predicted phage tail protein
MDVSSSRGPRANVALMQLSRQTPGRHEAVVVVEDGKSVIRSGHTELQIDAAGQMHGEHARRTRGVERGRGTLDSKGVGDPPGRPTEVGAVHPYGPSTE